MKRNEDEGERKEKRCHDNDYYSCTGYYDGSTVCSSRISRRCLLRQQHVLIGPWSSTRLRDKVYVPINATCTADDTNDPLGNVTRAEGLRCSTTTAIKQIGNTYGFVNVSTCTAAGGYNQKCLVNNTDSSFYCSAGYACSAQNAKVGKCQKGIGMSCEKDTECGGTSSCISGVCTAVGDLGQACIGNSSCQAGLSCNTTTSRGVCYTRDNTLCEDVSTYNLTKLCPNCGNVCTLGTDLVTVTHIQLSQVSDWACS